MSGRKSGVKRLTAAERALFLLPLGIAVFYFLAVQLRAKIWPPNPTIFPASAIVPSPDGLCQAQIVRVEREPEGNENAMTPDDFDHGSTGWSLRITRLDGTQCQLGLIEYDRGDLDSPEQLEAMRKETCQIAWDKDGRFLTWKLPSGFSGKALYLGNCLRNFQNGWPAASLIAKDPPLPLTSNLKRRLKARGCTAKEIARLKYIHPRKVGWRNSFFNLNPNVLLVLGPQFDSGSEVTSLGPIIALGNASFSHAVASQQWVFFDDQSESISKVDGSQIFAAPKTNLEYASLSAKPIMVP